MKLARYYYDEQMRVYDCRTPNVCDRDACPYWHPADPCPCVEERCDILALKRPEPRGKRGGHVLGCICRPCLGRRSQRKGRAAQAEGHVRSGGTGPSTFHEESAPGYPIKVRWESKAGGQVPKSFDKFLDTEWFRRALSQSQRAQRVGDGTKPSVLIRSRWLVVDLKPPKS